jgi:hypothetical protein
MLFYPFDTSFWPTIANSCFRTRISQRTGRLWADLGIVACLSVERASVRGSLRLIPILDHRTLLLRCARLAGALFPVAGMLEHVTPWL